MLSMPTFSAGGKSVCLWAEGIEARFSWFVFNGKGLFGPPSSRLSCTLRRETCKELLLIQQAKKLDLVTLLDETFWRYDNHVHIIRDFNP